MDALAITPFLGSPAQVEQALAQSSDFRNFLSLAEKNSGEPLKTLNLAEVRFRIMDAHNGTLEQLALTDTVLALGQPVQIGDLIAASVQVDRTRLIHSLWQLDTFDEAKVWLSAMRALVRVVPDAEGQLHGHLLLAETLLPMVETVERRDYVLPNGDMASDAITRNHGVRAKVFALDRARRTPRQVESHSIMERLSRTLSKGNR